MANAPRPSRSILSTRNSKVLKRLDQLKKGKKRTVFAGVLPSSTYPDGLTPATVMWILEFGTNDGKIPPRPLLRLAASMHKKKWKRAYAKLIASGISNERALKEIGELMAGDIRDMMSEASGLFKPNAPATVRKKGRNSPFRDTGHLLKSIGYEVIGGKEGRGR